MLRARASRYTYSAATERVSLSPQPSALGFAPHRLVSVRCPGASGFLAFCLPPPRFKHSLRDRRGFGTRACLLPASALRAGPSPAALTGDSAGLSTVGKRGVGVAVPNKMATANNHESTYAHGHCLRWHQELPPPPHTHTHPSPPPLLAATPEQKGRWPTSQKHRPLLGLLCSHLPLRCGSV